MDAWDKQRLQFEQEAMPHAQSLLRTAWRLTQSLAAAEDLVQDTLMVAWRTFERYEIGTDCKAWLFRIMLNRSSRTRSQAQRSNQIFTSLDQAENYRAAVHASISASAAKMDGNGAVPLSWEVEAMLKDLPEEQRVTLLLAAVEGFTCKEISAITNAPMGTVMSRLSRARSAMRERLLPYEGWCPRQKEKKAHGV